MVNRTQSLKRVQATPLWWMALPVLVALCMGSVASAACVFDNYSVAAEFGRSESVVVARTASAHVVKHANDSAEIGTTIYSVIISEALRGVTHGNLDVYSDAASGHFPLEVDQTYLLFLFRDGDRLIVDDCGNSGPLQRRRTALSEARRLAAHH